MKSVKVKKSREKSYKVLASVYDELMGRRSAKIYRELIQKIIGSKIIKGKSILDLGCGTGTLLQMFSRQNQVIGIDISPAMLCIARDKDRTSTYRLGDIKNFKFKQKFDLIFCIFDTINHLLLFKEWKCVFQNVARHLKEGGVFFFDFNTLSKFRAINNKTIVTRLKDGYVIMETITQKNRCRWDILVLRRLKNGTYQKQQESITEAAFPSTQIFRTLRQYFNTVTVTRKDRQNNRIFVACKNKN